MYIQINKLNIYYQKAGQGPNLILLPGWGQDVSSFWPLVEKLKKYFTLWLLDLPGFGKSDLPSKPFSAADYAQIVKDFIEDLKIKKPIILGYSHGGRTALKLSILYPTLPAKLILEDASGLKKPLTLFQKLAWILAKAFRNLPDYQGLKSKFSQKLYLILGSDYGEAGPLKETLSKLLAEDLSADLPKIKAPTLILWGEDDHVVPLYLAKKIYRLIPHARLEVLDSVEHFPHLENPELFVHYIKDFCLD